MQELLNSYQQPDEFKTLINNHTTDTGFISFLLDKLSESYATNFQSNQLPFNEERLKNEYEAQKRSKTWALFDEQTKAIVWLRVLFHYTNPESEQPNSLLSKNPAVEAYRTFLLTTLNKEVNNFEKLSTIIDFGKEVVQASYVAPLFKQCIPASRQLSESQVSNILFTQVKKMESYAESQKHVVEHAQGLEQAKRRWDLGTIITASIFSAGALAVSVFCPPVGLFLVSMIALAVISTLGLSLNVWKQIQLSGEIEKDEKMFQQNKQTFQADCKQLLFQPQTSPTPPAQAPSHSRPPSYNPQYT